MLHQEAEEAAGTPCSSTQHASCTAVPLSEIDDGPIITASDTAAAASPGAIFSDRMAEGGNGTADPMKKCHLQPEHEVALTLSALWRNPPGSNRGTGTRPSSARAFIVPSSGCVPRKGPTLTDGDGAAGCSLADGAEASLYRAFQHAVCQELSELRNDILQSKGRIKSLQQCGSTHTSDKDDLRQEISKLWSELGLMRGKVEDEAEQRKTSDLSVHIDLRELHATVTDCINASAEAVRSQQLATGRLDGEERASLADRLAALAQPGGSNCAVGGFSEELATSQTAFREMLADQESSQRSVEERLEARLEAGQAELGSLIREAVAREREERSAQHAAVWQRVLGESGASLERHLSLMKAIRGLERPLHGGDADQDPQTEGGSPALPVGDGVPAEQVALSLHALVDLESRIAEDFRRLEAGMILMHEHVENVQAAVDNHISNQAQYNKRSGVQEAWCHDLEAALLNLGERVAKIKDTTAAVTSSAAVVFHGQSSAIASVPARSQSPSCQRHLTGSAGGSVCRTVIPPWVHNGSPPPSLPPPPQTTPLPAGTAEAAATAATCVTAASNVALREHVSPARTQSPIRTRNCVSSTAPPTAPRIVTAALAPTPRQVTLTLPSHSEGPPAATPPACRLAAAPKGSSASLSTLSPGQLTASAVVDHVRPSGHTQHRGPDALPVARTMTTSARPQLENPSCRSAPSFAQLPCSAPTSRDPSVERTEVGSPPAATPWSTAGPPLRPVSVRESRESWGVKSLAPPMLSRLALQSGPSMGFPTRATVGHCSSMRPRSPPSSPLSIPRTAATAMHMGHTRGCGDTSARGAQEPSRFS